MKNLLRGLFAGLTVFTMAAAPIAKAEVLKWTLQNATFDDGGTASGSFDYNTITESYTAIEITTTAGSVLPGAIYTVESPATVVRDYGFASLVSVMDASPGDYLLDINTTTDFNTPGVVSIGAPGQFVSAEGVVDADPALYDPDRYLSGEVVSTVVSSAPEPSSWILMIGGVAFTGAMLRKHRQSIRHEHGVGTI